LTAPCLRKASGPRQAGRRGQICPCRPLAVYQPYQQTGFATRGVALLALRGGRPWAARIAARCSLSSFRRARSSGLSWARTLWQGLTADGPTAVGPTAYGPTADGPTADGPGTDGPVSTRGWTGAVFPAVSLRANAGPDATTAITPISMNLDNKDNLPRL